ncbi:MAG: hypothetical protein PHD76_00970 [Methylacidiphilales bacterium]|nr:hypothetical protein [Candidatus Methylacidiphilales bacterium]
MTSTQTGFAKWGGIPRPAHCLLAANLLVLLLLQLWRPFFFLTNDNLCYFQPVMAEIGRRLAHFQNPFYNDYIFGGGYCLLRDPSFINCWHPVLLLISLLASAGLERWIVELWGSFLLIVQSLGFYFCALEAQKRWVGAVSPCWSALLSLSWTYGVYQLLIGSSWVLYLANTSALPWLLYGLLCRDTKIGIAVFVLAELHACMGGHPGPFLFENFAVLLLALGLSVAERDIVPAARCFGSLALAFIILLPFVLPFLSGFAHATRADGLSASMLQEGKIPFWHVPLSWFLGGLSALDGAPLAVGGPQADACGLLFCPAAFCLLLCRPASWTGKTICLALFIAFAFVLLVRPAPVQHLFSSLPVFRSLRWPFKEGFLLLFGLHLWMSIYGMRIFWKKAVLYFGIGMIVFCGTLFSSPAPTIQPLNADRNFYLSGKAESFWQLARQLQAPGEYFAAVLPFRNPRDDEASILLGSCNYGSLFRVPCAIGYSLTRANASNRFGPQPFYMGFYEEQLSGLQHREQLIFLSFDKPGNTSVLVRKAGGRNYRITWQDQAWRLSEIP